MPVHEVIAVTVQDACERIGIGRTKLYAEIKAGRIEARKAGGRTLVLVPSLRAYIDSLPAFNAEAA